ncbi:unnamed protein product [Phytophthora lilii]|uniref:Unnamed protein product n=1 Tax=Phytophthora lilii TaxID=2077276 RepID=A0A9W6YIG1_9STRA|nr:unnamed protein product [Phytophthora lilii]
MSLSSYFSDNQTKQKAYDRFYNQMARSDFVQRRKLKALIAQEAADESLTDKLAQLYMSSVGKAPEYDYDKVLKKIQKAKPEVEKGTAVKIPVASASPATPATARRPRRSSMEIFLEDQGTNKFIKETKQELWERKHKKTTIPDNAREKAEADVESYIYDYQKKQRAKKSSTRRELTISEMEEAKKRLAEKILQQDEAPKSEKKKANRRLRMDDDETETKIAPEVLERQRNVERMTKLIKDNPNVKAKYVAIINSFKSSQNYDQVGLYNKLMTTVSGDIDARTRDGYFSDLTAIKPSDKAKKNHHLKPTSKKSKPALIQYWVKRSQIVQLY